jgi:hypothetical protein
MRRIKIDDDLIAKLDRMIEVRGYQNRLDVRDRYACHDCFSSVDALSYGIRSEATKKAGLPPDLVSPIFEEITESGSVLFKQTED